MAFIFRGTPVKGLVCWATGKRLTIRLPKLSLTNTPALERRDTRVQTGYSGRRVTNSRFWGPRESIFFRFDVGKFNVSVKRLIVLTSKSIVKSQNMNQYTWLSFAATLGSVPAPTPPKYDLNFEGYPRNRGSACPTAARTRPIFSAAFRRDYGQWGARSRLGIGTGWPRCTRSTVLVDVEKVSQSSKSFFYLGEILISCVFRQNASSNCPHVASDRSGRSRSRFLIDQIDHDLDHLDANLPL